MTHSRKPNATLLGATAGRRTLDRCRAHLGACCRAIGLPDGIKAPLKPAA